MRGVLTLVTLVLLFAAGVSLLLYLRTPPAPVPMRPPPPVTVPAPRPEVRVISVIIDDIGHNEAAAAPFLEMDLPLALAFLPLRPHSRSLAEQAHRAEKTVLLHLPMEPRGYPEVDPGEGAVLRGQRDGEIRGILEKDLLSVPFAAGINNHMGSMATEDETTMASLLEAVRERGFFFVDSRTTPDSVGLETALRLGVPALTRDVFLDNEASAPAIDHQVDQLLDLAEKRGWALGIGHPYPETAQALHRLALRAKERGIRWVPIEELVAYAGAGNRNILR